MKTVLITGGLGFIGTNIIRRLVHHTDYRLVVFDKGTYAGGRINLSMIPDAARRVTVIKGDILKRRSVEKAIRRADAVVHLAADTHTFRSLVRALPTVETNVIGTTILLETIAKYPVQRFILFSSSEVYGNQVEGVPMDEKHPLTPVTPYAASKLAADRIAYSFFLTKKLPITILRPFNAYGPFQHPEKMIPLFITKLLRDQPIRLNHGGKPFRDWVYVDDHARAVEMVLAAKSETVDGQIFNIGTGKPTTTRRVAEIILRQLHKNTSYLTINSSSQPETMGNVGISKKAVKVLGWKPSVTIEEGITKTITWYKVNRSWWERKVA